MHKGAMLRGDGFRLTDNQGAIVYDVTVRAGYGTEKSFTPQEVYPARNAADNSHRCTLERMAKVGMIEYVAAGEGQDHQWVNKHAMRMVFSEETLRAYRRWLGKRVELSDTQARLVAHLLQNGWLPGKAFRDHEAIYLHSVEDDDPGWAMMDALDELVELGLAGMRQHGKGTFYWLEREAVRAYDRWKASTARTADSQFKMDVRLVTQEAGTIRAWFHDHYLERAESVEVLGGTPEMVQRMFSSDPDFIGIGEQAPAEATHD